MFLHRHGTYIMGRFPIRTLGLPRPRLKFQGIVTSKKMPKGNLSFLSLAGCTIFEIHIKTLIIVWIKYRCATQIVSLRANQFRFEASFPNCQRSRPTPLQTLQIKIVIKPGFSTTRGPWKLWPKRGESRREKQLLSLLRLRQEVDV
jgi:hypothetical protein